MKSNWQTKKLGELFEITSSKRVFKSEWRKEGVPFYRAREIVKLAKHGYVDNELFISEEMYKKYSEKYGAPQEGDIMVTGVGTLGICYVVQKNDRFYFKDGNIIWLKTKHNVNSRFIEYAFKSIFRKEIENGGGATVGTFTIIKAKNTTISLPPIDEQNRIVKNLDQVFEKIIKAKENTEKNLQNSHELFESYLQNIFANPGKEWKEKKLGDVCEYDKTPNKTKNLPYIGLEDVQPHTGRFIGQLIPRDVKSLTFHFTNKHVLYGRLRPYLNKVLLPDFEGHCSTEIFPIKPKEIIDRAFLFHWLISIKTMEKINETWTGATLPRANMNTVLELKINIPSLSEQKAIVKKLETLSEYTKKLVSNYKEKLNNLVELKKSVLSKAFKGELITVPETQVKIVAPAPSAYIRNQVHAAIIDQVIRDGGWTTEVAVAKYDHLLQEVYGLQLGYQFQTQQFGPFDAQIKKLVFSGLGRNGWFSKKNGMIVFGNNISALLSRQSNIYRNAQTLMRKLSGLGITKLDANKIELLSTVCHSIKETKSTAFTEVRNFMANWQTDGGRTKADKFSNEQIQKCLNFISNNNLHLKLLQ